MADSRSILATEGIEKASDEAIISLFQLADEFRFNPDWLSAVISFESGWDPAKKNARSGATGLIQITGENAEKLGTSTKQLAAMSDVEQMDYVGRYLRELVRLKPRQVKNLADMYMTVLAPAFTSAARTAHLYSAPSDKYTQNKELDQGNKGYITKDDAATFVGYKFLNAHGKRRTVNNVPAAWPLIAGDSTDVAVAGAGLLNLRTLLWLAFGGTAGWLATKAYLTYAESRGRRAVGKTR